MKKIKFGISQLKERTPEFVKLLRSGSAKASLILVAFAQFYPQLVSKAFVTEVSTFALMVAAIAPYFGVKEQDTKMDGDA